MIEHYVRCREPRPLGGKLIPPIRSVMFISRLDNESRYKKKQNKEYKVILQFKKIHSFNCLSCFYSYLELQDDFIFQNLSLFIYFLYFYDVIC